MGGKYSPPPMGIGLICGGFQTLITFPKNRLDRTWTTVYLDVTQNTLNNKCTVCVLWLPYVLCIILAIKIYLQATSVYKNGRFMTVSRVIKAPV